MPLSPSAVPPRPTVRPFHDPYWTTDTLPDRDSYDADRDPTLSSYSDLIPVSPDYPYVAFDDFTSRSIQIPLSRVAGSFFSEDPFSFDFPYGYSPFVMYSMSYSPTDALCPIPLGRQRIYFFDADKAFRTLLHHSHYFRFHLHNLWLTGCPNREITFFCPGLSDPLSVRVICGDISMSDYLAPDEYLDFYNFLDVSHQLLLSDGWMAHLLRSTGYNRFNVLAENPTFVDGIFFLHNYFTDRRPLTYQWFENLLVLWPFESSYTPKYAYTVLKALSSSPRRHDFGPKCDFKRFGLYLLLMNRSTFHSVFTLFLDYLSRLDNSFLDGFSCIVSLPDGPPEAVRFRLCPSACSSCSRARANHSLRRFFHCSWPPLQLHPRSYMHASLSTHSSFIRKGSSFEPMYHSWPASGLHQCDHWCGHSTSLLEPSRAAWVICPLAIAAFTYFSSLSPAGRRAYRIVHRRYNYLFYNTTRILTNFFKGYSREYIIKYIIQQLNITQMRLVVDGHLPLLVSRRRATYKHPFEPRYTVNTFFPKPIIFHYKHYPNSLYFPVRGYD